ncbi:MAG TPA: hypothetical protein VLM16_01920 [Ginsengibacter sp.]|nr:hypothetical protein [Ginsengibacter sp.]
MICSKKTLRCLLFTCIFYLLQFGLYAQTDSIPPKKENDTLFQKSEQDTTQRKSLDEYLKTRKGFLGKMFKGLTRDTTEVQKANDLKRNDAPYKLFEGAVIRHIIIKDLRFGIPLNDTSQNVVTVFTRIANTLHHTTRTTVIRNNLFFKEHQLLAPYLMADNETYLRQLPYVQDAIIEVEPAHDLSLDSVDVYVVVKDLFSLGASVASLGLKNTDIAIKEDNITGSGNGFVIHGLYDMSRRKNFGGGLEYVLRNIGRSFTNFNVGYQSYYPNIVGLKEENLYYLRLTKPLINRYSHWTFQLDGSYHSTRNMYSSDSLYFSDIRYRFYNADAWVGYNINSTSFTTKSEDRRLRKLIGLRVIDQQFQDLPDKYLSQYDWRYANLTGVLASLAIYRQNFYKTQFIYAFGINEDVPEGLNLTMTAGYTKKQNLARPFIGFNYERSTFNSRNNYFSYALRAEGYLNHKSVEDINLFGTIDYFDHLKAMGAKWKQRTFVDIGIAKQINTILNEPLYIDSKYGLPEFRNGPAGGSLRTSLKAESVFYSPWHLESFRFAPFVFSNAGLFTPYNSPINSSSIFTIVGGGLRTRNESLIFGTLELKGYYFLKKNVYNENWRVDVSTDITFKYNTQLVRKPDFIQVN